MKLTGRIPPEVRSCGQVLDLSCLGLSASWRHSVVVYNDSGQISSRPHTSLFTPKGSDLEGTSPYFNKTSRLGTYDSIWPE